MFCEITLGLLLASRSITALPCSDLHATAEAAPRVRLASLETKPALPRIRAVNFSPRVSRAITRAAMQYGIDPRLAKVIVHIESGGNPYARTGSYKGLFQLDQSGFKLFGGSRSIYDTEANAMAGARSLANDATAFRRAMGRAPTPNELYMSHQQGQEGVLAHLRNPYQLAWRSMLSTNEGRRKGRDWSRRAIWGNVPNADKRRFGTVDNVTSRDLMAIYEAKISGRRSVKPSLVMSARHRGAALPATPPAGRETGMMP